MNTNVKNSRRLIFVKFYLYSLILFIFLDSQSIYAAPYEYQYRSARYLGRGDTGIASTSGTDAIEYNPAGIVQGKGKFKEFILASPQVEGSNNLQTAYEKKNKSDKELLNYVIENKNIPFYGSVQNATALVFDKFAIGAIQRGEFFAEYVEDLSTGIPNLEAKVTAWNGGYITLAQNFLHDCFNIGITTKYIQKTQYKLNLSAAEVDAQLQNNNLADKLLASEKKGNALGADFGGMLILDHETETQIGVTLKNVGMEYSWSIPAIRKPPDNDTKSLNAGISTSIGTKRGRLKLYGDYLDIMNIQSPYAPLHLHLGMEYNIENKFIVMVGLNQGYTTYGLAINVKILKLECGSYTEETGNYPGQNPSIRYFARLSIGWMI